MLTQAEALKVALTYAKNEWCLDDEALLQELMEHCEFKDAAAVNNFVDGIGEHYGLTRPATWGV